MIIRPYRFDVGVNPTTANLVAWWSLNEDITPGNIYQPDYQGVHHGTPSGGITDEQTGVVGNCFLFDGVNGMVEVNDHADLDLTTLSMGFWFKGNGTAWPSGSWNGLMGKRSGATSANYGVNLHADTDDVFQAYFYNSGWKITSFTLSDLDYDTWYFAVCIWEDTGADVDCKIYIDGILKASDTHTSTSLIVDINDLRIGQAGTERFNGYIDEPFIFNDVLTLDEILWLYNDGLGRERSELSNPSSPTTTDLVSWWSFNESSGTLIDSHGSNNGTQSGGVTYGATGKIGDCLDFDGTDDYVSATYSIQSDSSWSIGAWINFDDATSRAIWTVAESPGSTVMDRSLWIDSNGRLQGYVYDGAAKYVYGPSVLSTATWYHIVMVADGTDLILYLNGEPEGVNINVGAAWSSYTTPEIVFGQVNDLTAFPLDSDFFDGKMDEPFVFSKALSYDEVRWLYNLGNGRQYSDL